MGPCCEQALAQPAGRHTNLFGIAALAAEVGARDHLQAAELECSWRGRGLRTLSPLAPACGGRRPAPAVPPALPRSQMTDTPTWMRPCGACMTVSLGMNVSTSCSVSKCRPPTMCSSPPRVSCRPGQQGSRDGGQQQQEVHSSGKISLAVTALVVAFTWCTAVLQLARPTHPHHTRPCAISKTCPQNMCAPLGGTG